MLTKLRKPTPTSTARKRDLVKRAGVLAARNALNDLRKASLLPVHCRLKFAALIRRHPSASETHPSADLEPGAFAAGGGREGLRASRIVPQLGCRFDLPRKFF